ncbi:tryptophan halogenase [Halobacteriales archaeon QS_5_70_15]|nr:MAG: tryptophan halogenase [Halobacteriales archaeon QS_5_70_15]
MNGQRIETVTVVGGGDAGLISALTLDSVVPDLAVTVVDDFDEGIPEVGKSTISYIQNTFHNVLDIEKARFVSEVRPVWKASVYFTDWCGRGPFHVPFDDLTLPPSEPGRRRFEELYHRYETGNYRTLGVEIAERGTSPFVEIRPNGFFRSYDHVAYQFSTGRLNEFLRTVCRERGIDLVDDEVVEVGVEDGRIERVAGEERAYDADLYLDATGFERLLMRNLDNPFESFDLPLDAALVAKADLDLSEVVPATVVDSGEYGWFWQIDTWDWRDMGYVYSSEHASREAALAEFAETREADIAEEDVVQYRFDSGHYGKAWVGNCVAVGNALGFVEPLQSTALTLNAILTEKLSELVADHDGIDHRGVRRLYNDYARSKWENVYDFISVHYRYADGESEFWEDVRRVNDRDRLSKYVGPYRENGFNSHDELDNKHGANPRIFNQYIFYRLLRSLGVESEFYEGIDVEVSPEVQAAVERETEQIRSDAERHLSYEEVYGSGVFD